VTGIDGHGAPAGDFSITGPFSGVVRAVGGTVYTFTVTCTDAAGNTAHASADVVVPPDTTPPVFTSLSASPSSIWPPNRRMVTVTIAVTAIDDSGDVPTCRLVSIASSNAAPAEDAVVTGANTGSVRAVGGRTYSFKVSCTDSSGNSSFAATPVVVPPDTTAPVIEAVNASPYAIWPPNGKMTPVSVTVRAHDDVDAFPSCAISAITSNVYAPTAAAITGAFNVEVRAEKDSVYTLHVTCADSAGNTSESSVDVLVAKSNAVARQLHGQAPYVLVRRTSTGPTLARR
jgi:hypothetical protein